MQTTYMLKMSRVAINIERYNRQSGPPPPTCNRKKSSLVQWPLRTLLLVYKLCSFHLILRFFFTIPQAESSLGQYKRHARALAALTYTLVWRGAAERRGETYSGGCGRVTEIAPLESAGRFLMDDAASVHIWWSRSLDLRWVS